MSEYSIPIPAPDVFRERFAAEGMTADLAAEFQRAVCDFYVKFGRHDMEWRHTTDPYRIAVSEVMLQQTQVPRVAVMYPAFMAAFPTAEALAAASEAEVLAAWQGMGYNRRALMLQKMCRTVVTELGGVFPKEPKELAQLPGIGPATSCSIAAFAYNMPVVFIETNVRRIFIYYFFSGTEPVDDAALYPLVEAVVPKTSAREWYWALMDLGTVLARTVPNPNRKSRQYVKQAKFEGSNRQVRGAVLRQMLADGVGNAPDLARVLAKDEGQVMRVLERMAEEGFFVREENGTYRVSAGKK